jgi:hypothetical protein
MEKEMTPAALEKMKKLVEAATSVPWDLDIRSKGNGPVPIIYNHSAPITRLADSDDFIYPRAIENAAFIAASRSFVPEAIAEIERLRAELKRRDEVLAFYAAHGNWIKWDNEDSNAQSDQGQRARAVLGGEK